MLDGISETSDWLLAVKLHRRPLPKQRLNSFNVVRDLRLLFRRPAVRIVCTSADARDEHIEWSAEQHHMVEPVVETPLILNRPRHNHLRMPCQQHIHPPLVPAPTILLPTVVVSVDSEVAAPAEFVQDGGLTYA